MKDSPENSLPVIRHPLTLLIPLALIVCVAAVTLWELYLDRARVSERIRQQTIADVTLLASGLQAIFERAMRSGDMELIQEEMAALGANREYRLAVLTDESDTILHSMRLSDIGKQLAKVLPGQLKDSQFLRADSLRHLRQSMGGKVHPLKEDRLVISTYPLILGIESGELRPSRIGSLILVRDYSSTNSAALQQVARNAFNRLILISLLAIGLALVFQFAIARRLNRLARAAESFGASDGAHVNSGVGGSDEVARLAWAMDRMMTEKAEADRVIVKSQQRLQSILDSAIDSIITINMEGIVQSANQATTDLFGYEVDEVIGRNVSMLMPTPYAKAHNEFLANYINTGEKKIIGIGREVEGLHKSGSQFPIDLSVSEVFVGDQRFFLGIMRDISERKLTEELKISLGRIVEDSLNEIFIFDARSFRFMQANRGARENIGYSMEELRHLTPVDIKPEHTRESFEKLVQPLVTGEREQIVFETVHQRKDGSKYYVEVHLQRTTYQQHRAFVAIILDITERKEAATKLEKINEQLEQRVLERTRELEQAQQQLVRKEKLATLGQLAGGVAHEIRNPLGIIRNAAYYLEHVQDKSDHEAVDSLGEISRGLKNAEQIVSELLDFARDPGRAEVHPFPVNQAINTAIELAQIPHNIKLTCEVDETLKVNGDFHQIECLLTNLIQNARQAMPHGGQLDVQCQSNGGTVFIKVRDTGVGIAADELNKIFEPLFTKRAKGIGLGLALCRRYAELNHGVLEVVSEPGTGSTFTVSLPKA